MDLTALVNKHKNKILNIALVLIALIIANNIYKAQANAIAVLKENKDAELKRNALLGEVSLLEKKINLYKDNINKKDPSAVINTIGGIANESGVKIASFKPGKEKAGQFYTTYPFDLVVNADTYHNIGKFIGRLESHPDIYLVELAGIKTEEEQGEVKKGLSANIKVSTVLLPK